MSVKQALSHKLDVSIYLYLQDSRFFWFLSQAIGDFIKS